MEGLKSKLADAERRCAALKAQIARSLEQAEQQRQAHADADKALARARAQLASVRKVAEGKGSEIATVLRELGEVREKLSRLESAHDGKEHELARARELVERLRAALEEKERELAGMRARAAGQGRESEHQQIVQGLGASIKRLQGQVRDGLVSPLVSAFDLENEKQNTCFEDMYEANANGLDVHKANAYGEEPECLN
jgi:chromosome segregation ATPase